MRNHYNLPARKNCITHMEIEHKGFDVFRRARWSIIFALTAFLLIMGVGALGYKLLGEPGNSWADAVYMTFLMVATIGYGGGVDVWHRPELEAFTMLISIFGIAVMTYFFSSVTAIVLASDFDKTLRQRRMGNSMKKIQNHYILCGFGRIGTNISQELDATNRHYIAIDERAADLEALADKRPGLLYIGGDASDEDVLNAANIKEARGVFAITGDDSRNLMITLTARQMAPKTRIVARCSDMRNADKIRLAGADAIVSPNFTGGLRIASAMLRPNVVNFLDEMLRADHGLRVEEVIVPAHFAPRALADLQLSSQHYILLAMRMGTEWKFNPPGDFIVQPGYAIIIMTTTRGRQALEAQLLGIDREED